MKVAIPVWEGRISPVFDVARRVLVVELADGVEAAREDMSLQAATLPGRAKFLAELGVELLICGAISRPLEEMLAAADVQVIPHTCGPVEEVLRAFLSGQLTQQAFLMPGCRGGRRRFRARCRRGRPWP